IYIHSGALIFGSRNWLPQEQIKLYHDAGFNVVSIDYRLAPETTLAPIVDDVIDAIHWVRTVGSSLYEYDANKIALIGSSAGAYLSLLIGTRDKNIKSIISFYGYGDILGNWLAEPSAYYCERPVLYSPE